MFFPYRGDLVTLRAAQKICAGCPGPWASLGFALTTQAMGIWGGTTEQQREKLLGRRGGL